MKTTFIIAMSLAAAAITTAYAEDITPDDTATLVFASPKTPAQVRAELLQARADGSIAVWSAAYDPLRAVTSERTRDDVVSEAIAARSVPSLLGEDSGSFELSRASHTQVGGSVMAAVPHAND